MRVRPFVLPLVLAGLLAGAWAPAPARGGAGMLVGVAEDAPKWRGPEPAVSIARDLGLEALRVTVPWAPGRTRLAAEDRGALEQTVVGAWGLRFVLADNGEADTAPRDQTGRAQYCEYAADLLRTLPTVNDVVIWNEPNDGRFWRPQLNAGGASSAPADYQALLARCWTVLHSVRQSVNVIAASGPRGDLGTALLANASHPPDTWYRRLGAAYRVSGRRLPILDTIGHNPYPEHSAERPWVTHPNRSSIGEGDYERLMGALAEAFDGTAQPLPGKGRVSIWYMEQGFQTEVEPAKAHHYRGRETDRYALPALSAEAAADSRQGPAPDQATQLADAIRLAYCQPHVRAFFNFQLADESDLAGWQSGILWADWTPKPSYHRFRRAVLEVEAESIRCLEVPGAPARGAVPLPPPPPPPPPSDVKLQISNVRVAALTPFSATDAWRTTLPSIGRLAYGVRERGPTLWDDASRPALDHRVTLSGLSFSTAYRVWLTAIAGDGQRARATLDLTTAALSGSEAPAVDRQRAALLLDGSPVFPLIVWGQCPDGYAANLTAGITLFAQNPCGGLNAQLAALRGRALSAAVVGEPGTGGPGVVGFFYPDEADARGFTGQSLPSPPDGVPGVSFLTLTSHFYSGAAPLPLGRAMYPGLVARAGFVGFDLYALQDWCRPELLTAVYAAQRELVRLAAGKPTFQWIETATMGCPGLPFAVTPATVRAEAWLAIAGGAHGLGFFPARWSAEVAQAIDGVSGDLAALGSALFAGEVAASAEPAVASLIVSARSHHGALYVIAVNASWSPVRARIRVPQLARRPLAVLGERRRLVPSGDVVTDEFAPLAVHIYVAAPRAD